MSFTLFIGPLIVLVSWITFDINSPFARTVTSTSHELAQEAREVLKKARNKVINHLITFIRFVKDIDSDSDSDSDSYLVSDDDTVEDVVYTASLPTDLLTDLMALPEVLDSMDTGESPEEVLTRMGLLVNISDDMRLNVPNTGSTEEKNEQDIPYKEPVDQTNGPMISNMT
jgi:hypothetical protein